MRGGHGKLVLFPKKIFMICEGLIHVQNDVFQFPTQLLKRFHEEWNQQQCIAHNGDCAIMDGRQTHQTQTHQQLSLPSHTRRKVRVTSFSLYTTRWFSYQARNINKNAARLPELPFCVAISVIAFSSRTRHHRLSALHQQQQQQQINLPLSLWRIEILRVCATDIEAIHAP
jgi:hypothetical protein